MKSILEQLTASLDAREINYDVREEHNIIFFTMCGTVADVNIGIRIQEENLIMTSATLAVNLPEKSHDKVIDGTIIIFIINHDKNSNLIMVDFS